MKIKVKLSQMCSLLLERHYESIEPAAPSDPASSERIRELALARLARLHEEQKKEKPMKKTSLRILIAAAMICAMSLTAFAAFGGLEFFRSIFGDSARIAEEHIQSPMAAAENNDYQMTVESLLSDGFKTDIIVSLSAKKGKVPAFEPMNMFTMQFLDQSELEQPDKELNIDSFSYEEMPEFSQKNKQYYHLQLTSLSSHDSAQVKVSLREDLSALSVTTPITGTMARKDIHVKAEDYADQNYYPETVQLSPMGVLVIGSEKEAKGGLPTAQIFLQMKDGVQEELISQLSFDDGDETVMGGGSAVISGPGEAQPLVINTQGMRNPDGKAVTCGYFSRIIDLDDVQCIIVDDVVYDL